MTEDLSHLGDVSFDSSPEDRKAFDERTESMKPDVLRSIEEAKMSKPPTDEATMAKAQAELRQEIEDAQGEERW